jgi:hypothetical protein
MLKDVINVPQFYQPVVSDYLVLPTVILFILMNNMAQKRYQTVAVSYSIQVHDAAK